MAKKTKKKVLVRPLTIKPLPLRPAVSISYEKIMEAAEQSIGAGNLMIAEYQLKQVVPQLPNELYPKMRLLTCYTLIGRAEQAEALINDILKKFPRSVDALFPVAWYYRDHGQGEKALSLLTKADALKPRNFPTYFNLGLTYRALGRRDEAVAAFNKAIALNPTSGTCYFERALAMRGSSSPEDIASMEAKLNRSDIDKEEKGLLHLSVAWAYDEKEIDLQFEHINAGKELIAQVYPWSEPLMNRMFRSITGLCDKQFVAAPEVIGGVQESPIFIAAMPRSGTTLLEQILGTHSHIFPIGESEVIGNSLEELKLELGFTTEPFWEWIDEKGFERYSSGLLRFFHQSVSVQNAAGKRIVDKSLNNYQQIGLIFSLFPNARVIHLRRHPLDTILSIVQLFIRMGLNTPWRLPDLAKHYLMYEQYMTHWKSIFPERILTVCYEDLVNDQEGITREVLEFCKLPWEEACLEFYKQQRTVNTPSVMQVNQPINKRAVERWKPYGQHLKPAADILGIPVDA